MDVIDFIEKYFGIQLLTFQKLQLRMLMMEYAKYEGKVIPMIEILEKGTRKQCTCENCGAVLSYEGRDIKSGRVRFLDKTTFLPLHPLKYIRCPQCRNKVFIEGVKDD